MYSILVVGAGKEGKGFIGETFSTEGWKVSFLDKDPKVVEALKTGSYIVTAHQENGDFKRIITDYDAYLTDAAYSCMDAVVNCDVIALALYPEDIPDAAAYLGKGLTCRAHAEGKNLTIMCCTNKNHLMPSIEAAFVEALGDEDARLWFQEHVALRDAIVRRSTIAETTSALELNTTVANTLLLQQPVFADFDNVHWVELSDHIEQLKDIKLYTINGPHATCAYAGYQKGFKTINEAAADPEVAKLMRGVLEEAVPGLSREFNVPEKEIWNFCTLKQPTNDIVDAIYRVALDPIRKLGHFDRLTGNALFCLKHGIDPVSLIQSMANAFAYDEPRDEKAMEIQQMIADIGIEKTIVQICDLPEDHELVMRVAQAYRKIKA